MLRKELPQHGLNDFNFITTNEGINEVQKILNSEVVKKSAIAFSVAVTINFIKIGLDDDVTTRVSPCFSSKTYYLNNVSMYNVKEILLSSVLNIQHRFDDFVEKGSGWALESFKYLDLHITQVNDLRGGCPDFMINPLKSLTSRRAGLINIANNDNRCLLYCIAAEFTFKSQWTYEEKCDPENYIDLVTLIKTNNYEKTVYFPISLASITDLEYINRQSSPPIYFRVNVFREDPVTHKVQRVRESSYDDGKIINVLLVEFEHEEIDYSHYILIDKHSFLKKRYTSSVSGKFSQAKSIFCMICFDHFRSESVLDSHLKICGKQSQLKVFPKEDETLCFRNFEYQFKRIYIGYADFESVLEDTSNLICCTECNSSISSFDDYECSHSFTIKTKTHRAISVSFIVVDRYGKLVHQFCYTGDDVVVQFMKNVLKCEDVLVNTTKFNQYMRFGKDDKETFENTTVCYICKLQTKPFNKFDPKVRDHDHLTGKFLGAAHRSCNLNKRREKPFLSILMHNFSGYDSHLILPTLTKTLLPEIEHVNVIPRSGEKFMSIQINNRITFIDSMNFLSGSLDSLFQSIKDSCSYNIIKQSFLIRENEKTGRNRLKSNADERLKYVTKKGSFPYDWAKRVEDFSQPYLVSKNDFYNIMTRSHISDEEYKTAREIWKVFEMKNMCQYMETYCTCDTLLLAEIFETFRTECLINFEIEPCHFISLPGFAFQSFLKVTNANLEYITDPDLYKMLSENLRGGYSFSSQRYEESTEFKQMMGNASSPENKQHLVYIDANNL